MRRGYTLLELSAVLFILGLATSVFLSAGRRIRDRLAVVSAREAVAGLVAEARSAALAYGGAEVHVASHPWRAWYEVGGEVRRTVDVEATTGVHLLLPRSRDATELRYDALGLGRVASETVRFIRGEAEAALVVSAYGRVRRR